jgi:hypothetical protein
VELVDEELGALEDDSGGRCAVNKELHEKAKALVDAIERRYLGWYGKFPQDMSRDELIEKIDEMEEASSEIARLAGELQRQLDQEFLTTYLAQHKPTDARSVGGARG